MRYINFSKDGVVCWTIALHGDEDDDTVHTNIADGYYSVRPDWDAYTIDDEDRFGKDA